MKECQQSLEREHHSVDSCRITSLCLVEDGEALLDPHLNGNKRKGSSFKSYTKLEGVHTTIRAVPPSYGRFTHECNLISLGICFAILKPTLPS